MKNRFGLNQAKTLQFLLEIPTTTRTFLTVGNPFEREPYFYYFNCKTHCKIIMI